MKTYEGKLVGEGLRVAIVASRFNKIITEKLLGGAIECLTRHNVDEDNIEIVWVPGAFELPLAVKKVAYSGAYDAVITLGTVIRGSTPHFDYIAAEMSKGIAKMSQEYNLPIAFGVLTTDSIEQAVERAGSKHGNKGFDAAMTALEMADLMKKI